MHLMQNGFALSDPSMEEALYEIASLRAFAHLNLGEPIPDETTILNFRHLLEAQRAGRGHPQGRQRAPDAQGSAAQARQHRRCHHHRGAELDQERRGRARPRDAPDQEGQPVALRHEGHIAVDADSGLVHTVTTTAANEADVEQVADLLHGKEQHVWADSGYRGAQTRVDRAGTAVAHRRAAERHRKAARRAPQGGSPQREHRKASVRAKVEHPFRVIKRQFGPMKVRFRGLAKNTAHVVTLFALSNLWMARRQLMAMAAIRPTKRMRHADAAKAARNEHRVSSIARPRLFDESNALAFSSCSDLP